MKRHGRGRIGRGRRAELSQLQRAQLRWRDSRQARVFEGPSDLFHALNPKPQPDARHQTRGENEYSVRMDWLLRGLGKFDHRERFPVYGRGREV